MRYFGVSFDRSRFPVVRTVAVCLTLLAVLPIYLATARSASAQNAEARVALAQFTTAIENREPVDQVTFVANDVEKVFFYTDLRGLEGQTISHRWLHGGTVVANVPFDVKGSRWRVWSSKKLLPDLIGDWTVEIVTGEGEVIAAEPFTFTAPDA